MGRGEASSPARPMPRMAAPAATARVPAQVKDGVLHAQRKAEDAPGSLRIDGPIQPDGTAELIAKGLTGHPDNAVGHLTPATPYTYRIKARFEGSKGVGTRLDARKCDFTFTKQ